MEVDAKAATPSTDVAPIFQQVSARLVSLAPSSSPAAVSSHTVRMARLAHS